MSHFAVRPPLFHIMVATFFGVGFCPKAPGTMGAAAALVLWWVMYLLLPGAAFLCVNLAVILLCTILGVWSGNVMERYWGADPCRVVIDECVGVWIALLAVPCSVCYDNHVFLYGSVYYTLVMSIAAFVLFRFIDIFKPLGCRWIDCNVHGGWGIMLDDILAGLYAFVILTLMGCLLI